MKEQNSNIFIIGYMGSGKTTIGQALARFMDRDFVDMDIAIEKEQGMPVSTMFMKYGEHSFRNHEAQMLDKLVDDDNYEYPGQNYIISCESGIIQDDANRNILNDRPVIWLDCETDIMYERISKNPLPPYAYMHTGDEHKHREIFARQYEQRKNLYKEVSDITVNTGKCASPEEIVKEILEGINSR